MSAETFGNTDQPQSYVEAFGSSSEPVDLNPDFIGGIPMGNVRPDYIANDVESASRLKLRYRIEDRWIRILGRLGRDELDRAAVFDASVVPRDDVASSTDLTIGFHIHTRFDRERHPDFRAREMFDYAIQFIRHYNPEPLRYIRGDWYRTSDNYRQFSDAIARFGRTPTSIEELAAANSTWTGKAANANGFFAQERLAVGGNEYDEEDNRRFVFALGAPNYQLGYDETGATIASQV
jgi:hypothetical protein